MITFSVNNADIALPSVKGLCYCLSLSTKALIHNWLPGPGDLEGSTDYGVGCSKNPTAKQRRRESKQPDFIPFQGGAGAMWKVLLFHSILALVQG